MAQKDTFSFNHERLVHSFAAADRADHADHGHNMERACVTTIPTYGFNVEKITVQGLELSLWDIGGNWHLRCGLWHHYAEDTVGIICIVDSTDDEQIEEAKTRLWRIYDEQEVKLAGTMLLVFANKQDCLNALSVAEVKERLELETRAGEGRRWRIQGSVATTGDGLLEGMEWMATQLKDAM
ncbi:hypothetical protein BGW39_004643 [Mortierella sp. 14UC]|nr:hypothetical protein BGW39_004643 [Mortierella sp. 14UC]